MPQAPRTTEIRTSPADELYTRGVIPTPHTPPIALHAWSLASKNAPDIDRAATPGAEVKPLGVVCEPVN